MGGGGGGGGLAPQVSKFGGGAEAPIAPPFLHQWRGELKREGRHRWEGLVTQVKKKK